MNRLAIFVEGQTELLFVERLLSEIADDNQLTIEIFNALGGSGANSPLRMTLLRNQTSGLARHHVQIVNCNSDGNVKSYILDRYQNFVRLNFWTIVGIRDVYPLLFAQIASLRAGLANGVRIAPVNVQFVLGIMEVEAWFIAEHTHFSKIHPNLTLENIIANCGLNPALDDLQQLANPAADLHRIYQTQGTGYTKRLNNCRRTIDSLDCAHIYFELGNRFPDLQNLITTIDAFLALP